MGILDFFKGKSKRDLTYEDGVQFGLIHRGSVSTTNLVVNENSALGVSAIYCAVRVIAESIGSFPLIIYKDTPEGREKDKNHPYYTLLHDSPNPELTRNVFFETLMKSALLYGTGFAEIEWDNSRQNALNLWLIHPSRVVAERDQKTGLLSYKVQDTPKERHIKPEDLIVIPGIGDDGSYGYGLLGLARDNIGFSIACNQVGEKFFANGCRLSGTLNLPTGKLSPEIRALTKKDWEQEFAGVKNVGKTPILEMGMEYKPLPFSNEAGLFTDTRTFQITEASRLFNISPTKLFELGRATWGNLSTLNEDFHITTLRPWLEKLESEIEKKLGLFLTENYCEFNANAILRGDITTRYTAYKTGIEAGFLTKDEVREWENLPKLPPELNLTPPLGAKVADGNTENGQSMDE